MMHKYSLGVIVAGLLAAALLLPACGRKIDETTVIASVNGKPIYLKDLKRELSNRVRQNPSLEINDKALDDLVDTLIKRQIIIKEAMDRKMAEEQKFVDTIKIFWEQTLIRDFVDRKIEEFDRYIFVTDKEIEDYYNDLKIKGANIPTLEEIHEKLGAVLKQNKKSEALESWLEEKRKKSRISIDKRAISEAIK